MAPHHNMYARENLALSIALQGSLGTADGPLGNMRTPNCTTNGRCICSGSIRSRIRTIREFWKSSTGWSNPNICTKILPTRHSRSNQDPACLSEWVPAACGDGVVCVSYLAATHCWEQSINGLCMSHIHPMSLLIWSLCVHYTATHPRRPNRDARRL